MKTSKVSKAAIASEHRLPSKKTLCEHLERTKTILGLSQNELADLFDVRQPSLAAWIAHGIPATRIASVERLYDLSMVLFRELLPERIPEIVRKSDDWLDGRSILEVVKREGPQPVYGYLARLFAYQS